MRYYFYIFLIITVGIGGYLYTQKNDVGNLTDNNPTLLPEQKIEAPKRILNTYTVQDGDTFTSVIEEIGGTYSEALTMVEAASSTYDLTRIKIGKDVHYETKGGSLSYLEYNIDSEDKVVLEKTATNSFSVKKEPIVYDVELVTKEAMIESSLFLAGNKGGMSDALILEIAEILGWSIDFATSIKTGDSVKVYYEQRKKDGEEVYHGKIKALSFINQGQEIYGFLFEDEDGALKYYDENGNSLVKQFLKAPLTYSRVSSGYTNARFHPTQKRNMPHRAIDYAAPAGTPILAVGDGVVTMAQYYGGFGHYIDIRHNSTYETQYAHLSRYATGIKAGVKVKQGDIIGYVGSTGWSTGPHLHYQIRKNGELVNPATIDLPAGDPIAEENQAAFQEMKKEMLTILDS